MLVNTYGILKWNNANKKRYMELDYEFTKIGDAFEVEIKDITPTTRAEIIVQCDYCHKQYISNFKTYSSNKSRSISKKDCCTSKRCVSLKMEDSNLLKYGHKSSNSSELVKRNKIESLNNKYGENIINVSQIKDVRNKIEETNLAKYGYTNHLASPEYIKLYSNENHYKWKGGLSDTKNWLRNKLTSWKKETLLKNEYTCYLSNSNSIDIHHLYSFHKIIEETVKQLPFDFKINISDYSDIEQKELLRIFLSTHNKYGLGVCIDKDIHKLYHKIYGYSNNTPEQFEEFVQKYKNGELHTHIYEGLHKIN